MAASFYTSIPSFSDFSELLSDKEHFRRLPSNWCVLVSDVVGSTQAIDSGRYRDINTVGAACVAAVKNALHGQEFPYVFGGDGATIVVPCKWRDDAVDALLSLRRLTKKNFKLDLRVGVVSVGELEEKGATVEVARYDLQAGLCIALFRGGGLSMADTIVKNDQSPMEDTVKSREKEPSLDGLSCRWNVIPNKNGVVVSLLVADNPDSGSNHIYADVLHDLDIILNNLNDHDSSNRNSRNSSNNDNNPVNMDKASYKSFRQMIQDERRFHLRKWSPRFMARAVEIGVCHVIFCRRRLRSLFFDSAKYSASIEAHADHRKFDDMLRMVIDCTTKQAKEIERMLEERYQDHQVFYGMHRSKASLMTCLVEEVTEGQHIHFIDGDDGGYTRAAKGLKAQLKTAAAIRAENAVKVQANTTQMVKQWPTFTKMEAPIQQEIEVPQAEPLQKEGALIKHPIQNGVIGSSRRNVSRSQARCVLSSDHLESCASNRILS